MQAEMRAHGFEVRDDERVRWVVIAFDRTFTYAKLNTALQAVRAGARLIATIPIAPVRWRAARSPTAPG